MLRFRRRVRSTLAVLIPGALLAAGVFAGPLRSAEWFWTPLLSEVEELTALEPIRALPRTEAVLATLEAQRLLQVGRPYAAWETLRSHVGMGGTTGNAVHLLAARSAAEWGGWSEVRDVLLDQPWLAATSSGDGLLLLARAHEELDNLAPAEQAYRDYIGLPNARERGVAHARLGTVLSRRGEHIEAANAYAAAASTLPDVADWLRVQQVEQLVEAGDPSATTVATSLSGGSAPVRLRRVQLEAQGWIVSAETERAMRRLDWEARVLNAEGARLEAAKLHLDRARLLLGSTTPGAGRDLLRIVAADATLSSEVRLEAADELSELDDLSAAEALAAADGYEAASSPGLAARALRSAFERGAPDGAVQRLRLAHLLYEERDYGPARSAFQRAATMLMDREQKADAEMHAARSLFRTGGSARARQTANRNALTEFRRVVDRYEGTAAAGTALFILGDEASTTEAGRNLYRRAAAIKSSPDAREALFRVGDRSLHLDDPAGAIRAWEEYVASYPQGEQTARVAYEVGKLHETAGRRPSAQAMYTAATLADPISYYAVRAGERLGRSSIEHVFADPQPWIGLASEPGDAAAVLGRLDRLHDLGLTEAREAELQSALRAFERKPVATLVLAEGLRDRNEPVEAIRLARQLLAQRQNEWDERLLRLTFPFPYRSLIVAEAEKARVDPILYAALVRQESSFRSDAKSWVGATGLGQIMPATGRWLAPAVGIRNYEQSLLEVPEVNLRMGTRYLGDLLRRYDGAADLALAGYNAGPGRADRWRREFNHGRDTDAFRAAIPFDETRNYVMLVMRNAAVYGRLYGGARGGAATLTD